MSNNFYNNIVPANARIFINSLSNTKPINESFFTEQELNILRNAYKNSLTSGNKKNIQYEDYPYGKSSNHAPFGNMPQIILDSLIDKGYSLSNTIGRVNYYKDNKGNIHIKDKYDFSNVANFPEEAYTWSPTFRKLHNIGNKYIKPRAVDINIGKIRRVS